MTAPAIIVTEFEHSAVAFFDLAYGVQLALWPRDNIAHDAGLTKAEQRYRTYARNQCEQRG